jgi:hypothetical protein
MKVGCVEINGDQNYSRWEELKTLLPERLRFAPLQNGVFSLSDAFFTDSGKLFEENGYHNCFAK